MEVIPARTAAVMEEAFRRMFRRYVHTALEHREAFLFVEQYHLSPVIAEEGRIEEDFRLGAKRLTELGREGRLQPLDPLILDSIVLGTLNRLLCLHFAGYLMLDRGVLEAALSLVEDLKLARDDAAPAQQEKGEKK